MTEPNRIHAEPITVTGLATPDELTRRIIAASGPPVVDDLTTFLRKRYADRRAEAHELSFGEAQKAIASLDVQEELLDDLDTAIVSGRSRDYIDALLTVQKKLGTQFDMHPHYRESWRP